jgi:hypothetical protein
METKDCLAKPYEKPPPHMAPKGKEGQTIHQPKWYTKQEHAKMNQRVQGHAYIRARKNMKGMEIELVKKKEKKMGISIGGTRGRFGGTHGHKHIR